MKPPCTTGKADWPPDYVSVYAWRQDQLRKLRASPLMLAGAMEYYRTHPVEFINHWVDTYDPRVAGTEIPTWMPLVMFPKQAELVEMLVALVGAQESGLIEKARDMGATWVCCGVSVWLWRFWPGAAIGWGSRKKDLVDRIGDPSSIFEKLRKIILRLPREFWPFMFNPDRDMAQMKIINPETGASIIGEIGDDIGRGGRTLIYFKDEAAHYEHPEMIEAALGDNTKVQIDISSVNGVGNVFHRRREAGVEWEGVVTKGRTNILVMDWRDNPAKTQAWYDQRKAKAEGDGLAHVFASEVDRNYAASIEGVIIPHEWVQSAIDAHVKLGWAETGNVVAGLDVADEGGDLNALIVRKGPVLMSAEDWGEGDIGQTTRHAVTFLQSLGTVSLQYDSVGVGAGVKSEANRLKADDQLPKGITLTPWSAGAGVLDPDRHVIVDQRGVEDRDTPLNKDFYANLKAQGWWQLRLRFERTHNAVTKGTVYSSESMISLPSSLPKIHKLVKELCQPTSKKTTGTLKLAVDKRPPGTKSPNLADAVVMCYWPVTGPPAPFMLLSKRS